MSRSIPHALFLIFLLWLTGLGAAAQFTKIAVPFALLQQMFPAEDALHGWLLTLVSATGAVLGVVAGAIVARFGAVRLLVLALLLGGLMSLWQASLPGLPLFLASRLAEGLSHLGIVVAAPTLIARIAPDGMRNGAMALWSSFFGVSFALTAWFGLPVAEAEGIGTLFLMHGLAMLGLGAALALLLPRERREAPARADAAGAPIALLWRQHARSYGSPAISAPAVGWLFYTLTFVSLLTVLPGYLPEETRAVVTGALPLVSIATSLVLVPLLMQRWSAVPVIVLGFGLAAGVLAGLLLGLPLGTGAVALFAALGLVQGASFAAIPQLNPSQEDRALASGALAQTGNCGNLLGTPVLLAILAAGGLPAAFLATMALYAMAVAAHLHLARQRRG